MGKKYEVFTDGACAPNPGLGGYGIIIKKQDEENLYVGGEGASTNNRMEFMAVISSLKLLPEASEVVIHTDSKLVINVLTGVWQGKQTKSFIGEFQDASKGKQIRFNWVKGHNGHSMNELADRLAGWALRFNSQQKGFNSPLWGPVNVTKKFQSLGKN